MNAFESSHRKFRNLRLTWDSPEDLQGLMRYIGKKSYISLGSNPIKKFIFSIVFDSITRIFFTNLVSITNFKIPSKFSDSRLVSFQFSAKKSLLSNILCKNDRLQRTKDNLKIPYPIFLSGAKSAIFQAQYYNFCPNEFYDLYWKIPMLLLFSSYLGVAYEIIVKFNTSNIQCQRFFNSIHWIISALVACQNSSKCIAPYKKKYDLIKLHLNHQ